MGFFSPSYTSQQKNQLNLLNQQGGTQFGEAQNIYSQLDPSLLNQLNNPGYTPAQQAAITAGTLQPISSDYSSAAQNLGRIGARTNNTAGIVSGQDQLARQGAAAMGTAGNQVQTQIANNAQQQQELARQGLQSLYNPTIGAGENLYGQATGTANNPAAPSTFSSLVGGLGAASGAALGVEGGLGMFKRFGGPVKKKRPVIVGEEGPELFTPKSSGRIIPNPKTLAEENIYG